MFVRIVTTIAALVSALGVAHARPAPAAGPALRTAGPFLLQELRLKVDGRWGRAWSSLYPFHRLVAPRSDYVRCEARIPFVAPVDSLAVVRVRRASVLVPGLRRAVAGVAVTLRSTFRGFGRDPIVFVHTFHLVAVDGRWTWLLSPERYRLYRSEACSEMPAV